MTLSCIKYSKFKDSINYAGLSISKTNQTFIGCKLGDVNWDWNPAMARTNNNIVDAVELSYSTDALQTTNGSDLSNPYIIIPIKIKNFINMLGMQFTVHFNTNKLQWQGIGNNSLGIETGTQYANDGSISFLWVDNKNEIKTLEDGSVVFELLFKRTGNEAIGNEAIENTISVDGSVTAIAAYDKDQG